MPSKNFKVKNGIEAGSTIFGSASTTSAATLNIPHGTAPSSPTNGDFWTTTSGAYVRINGTTVGPLASSAGSGTTWGSITGTLSSQTDLQSALDAKLNLSGGTLTGNLTVSKASPVVDLTGSGTGYVRVNSTDNHAALYLDTQPNLGGSRIWFRAGGNARWMIQKNFVTESGSNVGSDLEINAYNDAGSLIFTPLTITRSTGAVNISNVLNLSSFQHTIKNGTPTTLNFAKGSQFGYSSGYRVVILGDTGTANNTSIALGYDPVANANGSFTGDGREILMRNAQEFLTPNATNDGWLKPLRFSSTGITTLLGLTTTGTTTINNGATPSLVFQGASFSTTFSITAPTAARTITFQNASGTVAYTASPTFTGTVTLPSTTSIGNLSGTEIGYLDGITFPLQGQLDQRIVKTKTAGNLLTLNQATIETSTSGWIADPNTTMTRTTADYVDGVASLSLVATATSSYGFTSGTVAGNGSWTLIKVKPNTTYTITMDLKNTVGTRSWNIGSAFFTATGGTGTIGSTNVGSSSSWITKTRVVTTQSTTEWMAIYFSTGTGSIGDTTLVDKIGLIEGNGTAWSYPDNLVEVSDEIVTTDVRALSHVMGVWA